MFIKKSKIALGFILIYFLMLGLSRPVHSSEIKTQHELSKFINYKNKDWINNPIKYQNLIFKDLIKKGLNTSFGFDNDFKNIKQFKINNISYNDSIVGKNMHKLKQEIKKEPNDYVSQVPESIIKKYAIRT